MSRDYISDLLDARMERRTDSCPFQVVDAQAVQPSIAGPGPMIVLEAPRHTLYALGRCPNRVNDARGAYTPDVYRTLGVCPV